MPLKLKLSGGDSSKRTKSSQSNSTKSSSSNHSAAAASSPDLRGKHSSSSRHGRHHAPSPARGEPGPPGETKTPAKDFPSSVIVAGDGDRRNNNNKAVGGGGGSGSPRSGSQVRRGLGSPRPRPAGGSGGPVNQPAVGRRPKSVSEPPPPPPPSCDDIAPPTAATGKSKETKPGRNRAFSVSRSGKFKEAKRRTSMLEIQDRFDKAARGESPDKS